jgi:hypothetical protein
VDISPLSARHSAGGATSESSHKGGEHMHTLGIHRRTFLWRSVPAAPLAASGNKLRHRAGRRCKREGAAAEFPRSGVGNCEIPQTAAAEAENLSASVSVQPARSRNGEIDGMASDPCASLGAQLGGVPGPLTPCQNASASRARPVVRPARVPTSDRRRVLTLSCAEVCRTGRCSGSRAGSTPD